MIINRPSDNNADWLTFYRDTVKPFWQRVEHRSFNSFDNTELHWCFYKVSEQAPLIVISPGRIEATVKYQELVWELAQAGISCAVLDHRGQGESQRLSANPQQGHVHRFRDFVNDFEAFEAQLSAVFPRSQKRWLLAHSMGGAIATLYLKDHPSQFDELILSSPMFSINTAGVPVAVAKAIAAAGSWLNSTLMPNRPWYFFGMGDYAPLSFEKNDLTHSRNRYRVFREVYEQQPTVQLGGPTFNWLHQALMACEQTTASAMDTGCAVTLFQAGADTVVSAAGQNRFAEQNARVEKIVITGARHELLMEADAYRQSVVDKLLTITGE